MNNKRVALQSTLDVPCTGSRRRNERLVVWSGFQMLREEHLPLPSYIFVQYRTNCKRAPWFLLWTLAGVTWTWSAWQQRRAGRCFIGCSTEHSRGRGQ